MCVCESEDVFKKTVLLMVALYHYYKIDCDRTSRVQSDISLYNCIFRFTAVMLESAKHFMKSCLKLEVTNPRLSIYKEISIGKAQGQTINKVSILKAYFIFKSGMGRHHCRRYFLDSFQSESLELLNAYDILMKLSGIITCAWPNIYIYPK